MFTYLYLQFKNGPANIRYMYNIYAYTQNCEGYIGICCIVLLTFPYVENFHNKKRKNKSKNKQPFNLKFKIQRQNNYLKPDNCFSER